MINKLLKFLHVTIYRGWCSGYDGKGYREGAGFDFKYKVFEIRRYGARIFQIITDVSFNIDGEWTTQLKKKLEETK